MISALEHFSYCPRQFALIHIEQAFDDNVHTKRGHAVHERVDEPGVELREGVRVERALPVWSERLGLIGKCDVVEFETDGTPYPIEYKHGPKRVKEHDDLQLAAQALCLEEMTGKPVPKGAIYHFSSRRRREVNISATLREKMEATLVGIRSLMREGRLPAPVNDKRCDHCSLRDICQPEAIANQQGLSRAVGTLFDPES
ncbi:MAG: CRISPR-associated protein Cas4 [Burkholderiales bacterium]